MNYDLLFEPVKIGPVTAPNRFYAVPHSTGHGHLAPQGSRGLREMKAAGGWGTVCTSITEISATSDLAGHQVERIWGDVYRGAHAKQVEAIKKHGALAGIELGHAGMRSRNFISGVPVIGPSNLPIIRPEMPLQARAMGKADIWQFRQDHRRAAQAAKEAGYDIIYVYAAHDISIFTNFLTLRTNHRTDEYGGSLENRARLLREVLEDTLEVADGQCAVALRFSVHETNAITPIKYDAEGRDIVEMLAHLPDLWDVNISGWSSDSNTSRFSEEGHQLPFTDFVKSVTNKPVVGVGRYTSPDKMVSLIESGKLDLIGAARPSIADPYLPNKIKAGQVEDIRECIGCNVCVSCDAYGVEVRCTQNPTMSEEWRRGWHPENIPEAKSAQNILIVGGGPAGLECAWTLARAGHQVTLAEAEDEFGGRSLKESGLVGLSAWRRVRDYRVYQLQQRDNVTLYPANKLSAEDIKEFRADQVIIATGASWRNDGIGSMNFAPLPWLNQVNVLTPDDVMSATKPVTGHVVVYDDEHNYMGSVMAEQLRKQGHSVTLVTPHREVAAWTDYTLEISKILNRLAELEIPVHTDYQLQNGNDTQLNFEYLRPAGKDLTLDYDTLVFVGARSPKDGLYLELQNCMPEDSLHLVGDALVPGINQAAVFSGHKTARSILAEINGEKEFFRLDRPDI